MTVPEAVDGNADPLGVALLDLAHLRGHLDAEVDLLLVDTEDLDGKGGQGIHRNFDDVPVLDLQAPGGIGVLDRLPIEQEPARVRSVSFKSMHAPEAIKKYPIPVPHIFAAKSSGTLSPKRLLNGPFKVVTQD